MNIKKLTKLQLRKKERRLNKRIRKEEWRKVRLIVLDRDNWRCQMCGKDLKDVKPGNRHIHHIIPKQYKELYINPLNLITLCAYCHHYSKNSAHQSSLIFSIFLMINKKEQYNYLFDWIEKEINLSILKKDDR